MIRLGQNAGSAIIQSMIVVSLLSVVAGTVATMTQKASQEVRTIRLNREVDAMGRYIAMLGADEQLCSGADPVAWTDNFIRFNNTNTVPVSILGTMPAVGGTPQIFVRLPFTSPTFEASGASSTWYPTSVPTSNQLPEFRGHELVGFRLRDIQYEGLNPAFAASDPTPVFSADLMMGVQTNSEPRLALQKNIARIKFRVQRPGGLVIGCSTTLTDEEYCRTLGGEIVDSSTTVPDQPSGQCRFKPAAVQRCPNPNEYIKDIDSSGQPICATINECPAGEFAYAFRGGQLLCRPFNRQIEYVVGTTSTSVPEAETTTTPPPVSTPAPACIMTLDSSTYGIPMPIAGYNTMAKCGTPGFPNAGQPCVGGEYCSRSPLPTAPCPAPIPGLCVPTEMYACSCH